MTLTPDASATPAGPSAAPPARPIVLRYTRPDDRHLTLEGGGRRAAVYPRIRVLEARHMRLMSSGFHWIDR